MFPSSGILSFYKLLATSDLDGGRVSRLFYLFRIGGTEARNISKVLRSAIVVVLIMNVLCRALSFLPLLDTLRAELMIGLYLRERGFAPVSSGLRSVKPLSFLLKARKEARN